MMTPSTPSPHLPLIAYLGIALLVGWSIYRRVRRLVGRQALTRWRPWFSLILFPLLLVTLLAATLTHPARALAELAGIAVGVSLGFYGLRVTKFESTPSGLFYTPSAHIGIGLSLLLVARIAYRAVQGYLANLGFMGPPDNLVRTPLTLLIIGTLAGYYATYAFGLLRWRRSLTAATPGPAVRRDNA